MVSLGLSLTFGFYGLIKKGVKLSSDVAMLVEVDCYLPFVSYLSHILFSRIIFFLFEHGNVSPSHIRCGDGRPLLCFSEAVKRAPLNLIGFIQYLNPTIQLLVAILIFGETVQHWRIERFSLYLDSHPSLCNWPNSNIS